MKYKLGFTLIEVIVSMGIFFVLASISYMQNPNGLAKIRFNTYINELSVYIKELSIYGSSAGDISGGIRVGGVGVHIDKVPAAGSRSIFAFYDIATTLNNVTSSDRYYTASTDKVIDTRISYDDKISIVKICPIGIYICDDYKSADITFIRPSTNAKLSIVKSDGSRYTVNGLEITVSFKGIDDKKCITINSIGLVTIYDEQCIVPPSAA